MKLGISFYVFYLAAVVFISAFSGCNEGDVRKASGNYEVTVIGPVGQSDVGSSSVSNSGDFFSIVINSDLGNFTITGTLDNNVIDTTDTNAFGNAAHAVVQFSVDRNTFTGTIETTGSSTTTTTTDEDTGDATTTTSDSSDPTLGTFVVRGIHL